jgi:hypothetical protein
MSNKKYCHLPQSIKSLTKFLQDYCHSVKGQSFKASHLKLTAASCQAPPRHYKMVRGKTEPVEALTFPAKDSLIKVLPYKQEKSHG